MLDIGEGISEDELFGARGKLFLPGILIFLILVSVSYGMD
jgi:hypothetical protein